jgi:sec-independent protein translocase protein TatC
MPPLLKRSAEEDEDKRMELTEHLAELRTRIMRSIAYVIVGSIAAAFFVEPIYRFFYRPMAAALKGGGVEFKIAFAHFTEPFFVVFQICVVSGLIIASPLIILELWGFVRPALTREERKPLRWIVPMSVCLFVAGASLAYGVSTYAMHWFLGYVNMFPHAVLYQGPKSYVVFVLKLIAVFGLVFQLPLLLMFLAWAGLLRSETMKKSWRHAIVIISVVGLFVTPSNDAFTMMIMIVPVFILYLGSIWLVRLVEKSRERKHSKPQTVS